MGAWLTIYVVSYITSAITIFGMEFADFQRRFPLLADEEYWDDVGTCAFLAMLGAIIGPLGVLISFLLNGCAKYGLKYR